MVNIAVCDRNESDLVRIAEYIKHYGARNGFSVKVDTFKNCNILLADSAKLPYKIVIMDVYYQNPLEPVGLSAARRLRERDNSNIIFHTSDPSCAAEAFQIGAAHYLIKPCSRKEIGEALDRCSHSISSEYRYLEIKAIREGKIRILHRNLLYAECFDRQLTLYTIEGAFRVYMTLGQLFSQLDQAQFCRPQRSYVVNLSYVTGVRAGLMVLKNGFNISISRNRTARIGAQLRAYVLPDEEIAGRGFPNNTEMREGLSGIPNFA